MFWEIGSFYQYIATFSGTFAVICSGIHLGWTSPYLPEILDLNSTEIHATNDQGSWCAVMTLIGAPFGAFLTAFFIDRIGRKPMILIWAPVMLLSFICIAFAKTIFMVSVARFFGGAVEGALYTSLPMYVSEISEPNVRGKLSSAVSIAAKIGTLFINVIGPKMNIRTSSLICSILPLIHFATFVWMPESPYYFLKKKQLKEAESSLKMLRNKNDVQKELLEMAAAVKRQEGTEAVKLSDLFRVKSNRRAAFIFIILALTNKFSGKNPFLFYTATIFSAAETNFDPHMAVVIYCSLEIVSSIVALFLIDRYGRRPLIIFSACGCAFALLLEGLYFFFKNHNFYFVDNLSWWPILALIVYNIIFSLGLAFGPVLLLSELFPTNIKSFALCSGDTFSMAMGVVSSKFFQISKDTYGMHVPFFAFSFCCFLLLPVIMKILPETKGKSLEQIQLYLIGKQRHTSTY